MFSPMRPPKYEEIPEYLRHPSPPPREDGPTPVLPTDVETREEIPMCTGLLDYFPLALAAVANCSLKAGQQHHPGEPMHWERGKSTAHADKIVKHLTDRGTFDTDGVRHSTKLAWRSLALLQTELEAAGGLPGRASVFTGKEI
jgi:hypothetical protein